MPHTLPDLSKTGRQIAKSTRLIQYYLFYSVLVCYKLMDNCERYPLRSREMYVI